MSLTNFIETHSRRARLGMRLALFDKCNHAGCSSTGCGLPIVDPHICHSRRDRQEDRLGNPESNQGRYALMDSVAVLVETGSNSSGSIILAAIP